MRVDLEKCVGNGLWCHTFSIRKPFFRAANTIIVPVGIVPKLYTASSKHSIGAKAAKIIIPAKACRVALCARPVRLTTHFVANAQKLEAPVGRSSR